MMNRDANLHFKRGLEEAEIQSKETQKMADDLNSRILKAIEKAREGRGDN